MLWSAFLQFWYLTRSGLPGIISSCYHSTVYVSTNVLRWGPSYIVHPNWGKINVIIHFNACVYTFATCRFSSVLIVLCALVCILKYFSNFLFNSDEFSLNFVSRSNLFLPFNFKGGCIWVFSHTIWRPVYEPSVKYKCQKCSPKDASFLHFPFSCRNFLQATWWDLQEFWCDFLFKSVIIRGKDCIPTRSLGHFIPWRDNLSGISVHSLIYSGNVRNNTVL